MKIIIKTSIFTLILFFAVTTGCWINSKILKVNEISLILNIAEKNFTQFEKKFDSNKKTIIVIGRSSAMYSFRDGEQFYDRYSFVDRLKKKFNVINLVSGYLLNFDQVHEVLDFANSRMKNIDYFIIENPVYLTNEEIINGENDLIAWMYCRGDARNSIACKNFNLFSIIKNKKMIKTDPCEKKYKNALDISYIKNSNERKKIAINVLKCGESFGAVFKAKNLVANSYSFGFAQDLKNLDKFQTHINKINNSKQPTSNQDLNFRNYAGPNSISFTELLLIDKYMKDILKEYPWTKIIFIPNHAREVNMIKELSVFKNNGRIHFLDLRKEINSGPRSFAENFPDGTHPHFWIQDLIAEKIFEIIY